MAAETRHREMDQRRSVARAHMVHHFLEEARRLLGIRTVAIADEQVAERSEIFRDIAAWRLHIAVHGDAKTVVFYIEEHRELQCCRHREGGPETTGRYRRFTAERNAQTAGIGFVFQRVAMVYDRLRPSRGGRVLGADVTR